MAHTINYKTELQRILGLVDSDQTEEIMEMNPNYEPTGWKELKDITQEEALHILEKLQDYKAEGCDLQGEPITFDINLPNTI